MEKEVSTQKKTTEPNGYAGHWAQKYSAKKMLKIRGSRFRPHQLSAKEERRSRVRRKKGGEDKNMTASLKETA